MDNGLALGVEVISGKDFPDSFRFKSFKSLKE